MIPSNIAEQFPIVFNALNIGFLQTLKLFIVTLLGALPLGLLMSFGSMSKFKPLSGEKIISPEDVAEIISRVTRDDVITAAKGVNLHTVYKLLPKGGNL